MTSEEAMSEIQDLKIKKDGMALKALAEEGDLDAGLAFAELVFDAKYAGDEAAIKAKKVTKKDEKEKARLEAFAFIEAAAESDHLPGLVFKAETKFSGVREPGPHGSQLAGAFYGEAESLFAQLLARSDCPEDRRGEFLIKQAQSIDFKARIKGLDRREEVLDLLKQALEQKDSKELAHYILSGLYWNAGQHKEGVEHALNCYKAHPFAALTLQKAHEKGLGVEQDDGKAATYYQFWFAETAPKRRSQ